MVKRKNPFAIDKNGNLIYIKNKDYEHKKQYKECYCAKCNELLIPKMGDKNIWHFSHKNNTNCDGSYETNLHKYAKEIIKNNTKIELPKLKLSTYRIMRNFLIKERNFIYFKI